MNSHKSKYNYVMLIDDNEVDNFINEKLIHTTLFAKSAYVNSGAGSALEFLKNVAKAYGQCPEIYPEVIFVDINMPGANGFQFISAFNQITEKQIKKPRLVILTSSVAEIDKIKTREISDNILFLNKPLSKEMLEVI